MATIRQVFVADDSFTPVLTLHNGVQDDLAFVGNL
jgi:hypothetical protein